jgi:hypothetical protein
VNEIQEMENARGVMAPRVVALFQRVAGDRRPITRMEMPQEDMDRLGVTDSAWGIPCTAGPTLAAYGADFDTEGDPYECAIRYEEVLT